MSEVTTWIGLGFSALGMTFGGMAYVQQQLKDERNRTDGAINLVRVEFHDRHKEDVARLEKAIDEERIERRRELDEIKQMFRGFADVATAVISMGKSMEHLTEKLNDHQRHTDRAIDEVKHAVRSMDEKLQTAAKAPRTRAPRVKK